MVVAHNAQLRETRNLAIANRSCSASHRERVGS